MKRGVTLSQARRILLGLADVTVGRSYGYPAFLLGGRFFARFRDDDTVLVLQLTATAERDVLMQLAPDAFFFTEHYKNYPSVLIRLAEVPPGLFAEVVGEAHRDVAEQRATAPKPRPRARAAAASATRRPRSR